VANLWLGTSGFSYKEWRPDFYPADLPPREFLRYYASRFNSVEIDSTFYRMPNAARIEAWKGATGEGFRFSLKASRRITHQEQLRVPSDALGYLIRVLSGLEHRLGTVLFQLPPFLPADPGRLEKFVSVLPRGFRCAFEFRHDSWFAPGVLEILREHGAALCIHDVDDRAPLLELTAPFTYVRLRRSEYGPGLRQEWGRRMNDWTARGIEVYAYLKHEGSPRAPAIAEEFGRVSSPRAA
jgi:uncharacterized protein YecE (DUF72 family)